MAAHQIARGIAQLGRNGDSMLMHVQPEEVAGLQALAKSQGTSLTINPDTGLPEAFSLGGFFKSLAPTLAGAVVSMIPGMQPFGLSAMQAGILAGAATGALTNKKDPLLGAAMGGLGGYGGANLATAAGSFGKQAAAADFADDAIKTAGMDKTIAAIQTPGGIPVSPTADTLHAGAGQGFYGGTSGLFKGPTIESTGLTAGGYGAVEPTFGSNLSQAASNVAANPMGFISQNKLPLATTLGGAALGGLEPSDLGYGNMNPDTRGKYDPYSRLNLSGDTGLRLYAQGGPVSFADGGDANKDPAGLPGGGLGALAGGDSGAMQGAGMLPLDVSDINAKYGLQDAGVPVPKLGLFADNDQIETARTAYEAQLKAAMSGRGGMGSPFSMGALSGASFGNNLNRGMGGAQNPNGGQGGMGMMSRTIGGSGMGATAPTAGTAETALSRLNLNKTYANGGTIQSGGIRDLYGSQDDSSTGPMLSREGYGLGRLQAMADGGVAGYAEGGETSLNLDRIPSLNLGTGSSAGMGYMGGMDDTRYMASDKGFGPVFAKILAQMPQQERAQFLSSGMGEWTGIKKVPKQSYFTGDGRAVTGYAKGGYLDGPGDGMSDSIPATIEGKQPARLADGEFVVPADVVSHLGNGSTKAGSQRLYGMLDKVRKARTGTKKQGKQINPEKYMPA